MKKNSTDSFVPDWAKDAVWYQIFPERFRNGAPASNPRVEDITDRVVVDWQVTPWGQDWYEPDAWAGAPASPHALLARRYGGDLVGVRDKLDYLQELGVTAIYLNPVFTARSLHKYDGATFHHIDPTLGPDREGDLRALAAAAETEDPRTWIWTAADRFFLDLVADVHARGMRIILDGVFNHTGREFFAFQDLLKHGRQSRYADWYRLKRWLPDGSFEYKGWFGFHSLPELNRRRGQLVAPVQQYIFDITRRWMDPDRDGDVRKGIDGWRLDVAFCVPMNFWRAWRRHVKGLNPDAYLTAEIVKDARRWLQGDQFDAVMNYMWLYPSVAFFAPAADAMKKATFQRKMDRLRAAYPEEVMPVLQNLLDSHDVGRIASMLENADGGITDWEHYFHVSRAKENPAFVTTRPGPRAFEALRQLVVFQMTYPGAPMIYYGTEVGMWGANDPDNRQPMFWDDIPFAPETHAAHGPAPAVAPRVPDPALFAFFQRAIRLRREHAALRRGTFAWLRTGHARVLGYERHWEGQRIFVWLNTDDSPATVRYTATHARDLWDGQRIADDGSGRLEVPARGWRVVLHGE
jgi:cyclomaltodextrinase / maltogenic alpha-amylase / neopullulanase